MNRYPIMGGPLGPIRRTFPQSQTIRDALTRWTLAEAEAVAADRKRVGSVDPELNRRAGALRTIADNLKKQVDIALAADAEARKTLKDEAAAKSAEPSTLRTLGKLALLASPLAAAAILIRRMR